MSCRGKLQVLWEARGFVIKVSGGRSVAGGDQSQKADNLQHLRAPAELQASPSRKKNALTLHMRVSKHQGFLDLPGARHVTRTLGAMQRSIPICVAIRAGLSGPYSSCRIQGLRAEALQRLGDDLCFSKPQLQSGVHKRIPVDEGSCFVVPNRIQM